MMNAGGRMDNLDSLLVGIGLEKYIGNFKKFGIDFDSVINLTPEEMESLGVDSGDRDKLITNTQPLQYLFNEFSPMAINNVSAYSVCSEELQVILGVLVLIKRRLMMKELPRNILVDNDHVGSAAILTALDGMAQCAAMIKADLSSNTKKKSGRLWGWWTCVAVASGCAVAVMFRIRSKLV